MCSVLCERCLWINQSSAITLFTRAVCEVAMSRAVYVCPRCKTRIPFGTMSEPAPTRCPGARSRSASPSSWTPSRPSALRVRPAQPTLPSTGTTQMGRASAPSVGLSLRPLAVHRSCHDEKTAAACGRHKAVKTIVMLTRQLAPEPNLRAALRVLASPRTGRASRSSLIQSGSVPARPLNVGPLGVV